MINPKRIAKKRRKSNSIWFVALGVVIFGLVAVGAVILSTRPAVQLPADTAVPAAAPAPSSAPAASTSASGQAAPTAAAKTNIQQWSTVPPMTIDKTKTYIATVTMAKGGKFDIQLYPDKAPVTVNSFVFLARQKFFDGTTFHRVLEGFMAQGGDPTGTGTGGPGYNFDNEKSDLKFDKAGVVAMANTGQPNSDGSQFFITFGPTPQLDGGYTIFGQVINGMDVVNAITRRDPETNPTFTGDVMQSVTITEK